MEKRRTHILVLYAFIDTRTESAMACLAPNKLGDGTEVACRECKLCQLKAKNDWVGRNIAESKTAKFCYCITATYGRGKVGEVLHERAVVLTYSDCQKFLKLLRRHGCEVRFFITGEYGSERQRAHWNIILYSDKPLPRFAGWDQYGRWTGKARMEQRFNWVRTDEKGNAVMLQDGQPAWWWPHGFVHIDEVSVKSVRYVCKYVLKDFDANGKQGHKGQSKDPPLGTQYFRQLAEKYVEQGLAPQSPEYRFPEAKTRDGEPIRFWLKGRVLEIFLQHYIDAWAEKRGVQPRPTSEFVDLFEQYGRVINDEQKMLTRQAFPKGETLLPLPSPDVIRREAEQARYEQAVLNYQHGMGAWWEQWVEEGTDGEERQKRQEQSDAERVARWYAFQAHWGRHYYEGDGWQLPAGRQGSCVCCQQLPADNDQPGQGDRPSGRVGFGGYHEAWLGPVGRYNADHSGSK